MLASLWCSCMDDDHGSKQADREEGEEELTCTLDGTEEDEVLLDNVFPEVEAELPCLPARGVRG